MFSIQMILDTNTGVLHRLNKHVLRKQRISDYNTLLLVNNKSVLREKPGRSRTSGV